MCIRSRLTRLLRVIYIYYLGTEQFLAENIAILTADHGAMVHSDCNKDTGEKQKSLQKWSRGLMHFVRGSGFIDSWSPLFV